MLSTWSALKNVSEVPSGTAGGSPSVPDSDLSPGRYWKLAIVTRSVTGPVAGSSIGSSHGGRPYRLPHTWSVVFMLQARLRTPSVTSTLCLPFFFAAGPTRYGLQRPFGGCAVSM